jgi:serine/threonine-protein kinase
MTDFQTQLQGAVGAAYEIERELAGGGMSRVFVATERALGRRVVIKVLPPDLAAGVNRERFRREIQLAAQLHHPHIVPLLSAGEGDGILYYTMPFIEGESLRMAVERQGRLPVADVIRVLHDVVDALAYAHARGVIHRDIKPGNILRLGTHALVTDFGVAKALSAAMPISGVTTAGIAIGTPSYMAPEQLAGDPAADHRVDLYAVGLLAYELLVGESPFSAASPAATMAAQLTRTPDPLHEVRPEVPRELSDLIMRCLEKNPDQRPPTAEAVQTELDAVSTRRGGLISGETAARTPQRSSAARGALAGAAVVVVLSAIAYALVVHNAGTAAPTAAGAGTPTGEALKPGADAPSEVPASAVPPATVLTAADSLAIAAAVNERLQAEGQARERLISDSIRARYWQDFADSIQRSIEQIRIQVGEAVSSQRERAAGPQRSVSPPRPGERRVVVMPFANRAGGASSTRFARTVSDTLRGALRRADFDVMDERITLEATRGGVAAPTLIGARLRAPAVVVGQLTRRDGKLVVQVQVTGRATAELVAHEIEVDSGTRAPQVARDLVDRISADLAKIRYDLQPRGLQRGGDSRSSNTRRDPPAPGRPPPAAGAPIPPPQGASGTPPPSH